MEVSHTDSTNQTEPCECPLCTRNIILPRHASLRSSKRNIEAEKTSSSVCSQPQKKSTEHSFATGGEPEMRQEESENTVAQVGIAGMIEDGIGETEKEPLAEAISTVGCSSSSTAYNLKLTEILNMVDAEEEDEVDSVTPSDALDGYQVKPEYIPILEKILSKNGDIAENCTILTSEARSLMLEMICCIISELQEIDLYKINEGFLLRRVALVNEFKKKKVQIDWLHKILDEILKARKLLEEYVTLKEWKDNNKKVIENAREKMDECEEQLKEMAVKLIRPLCDEEMDCKERLEKAMDESIRINQTIKYALSKLKRFINGSLVDDLI